MDTLRIKEDFLRDDLYNGLKELFVGAVTWRAHQEIDTCYLRDLGMFTCFVQARALYEFFYNEQRAPECGSTASAHHFASSWKPSDERNLYSKYMAKETPAQKRVFHLVYGRSEFSGGRLEDECVDLKSRVLDFARDVKRLTAQFAESCVDTMHRGPVESALNRARCAADELAKQYNIECPV